jgi:hypothetical protein
MDKFQIVMMILCATSTFNTVALIIILYKALMG